MRHKKYIKLAIQLVLIICLVAIIFWANRYAAEHDVVREFVNRFGYVGLFGAAAISGFNLVIPIPVITFFPFFMEVGFHPALTVVVIAVGMSLGDLFGFLIGNAGREAIKPKPNGIIARLEKMKEKNKVLPVIVLFLYAAFAPAPNELIVIPMAFLGYSLRLVFTAILIGNIIFNSLVAFGVLAIF